MKAVRFVPFLFVGAVVAFLIYAMLLMNGLAQALDDDPDGSDRVPVVLLVAIGALVLYVSALGLAALIIGRRRRVGSLHYTRADAADEPMLF